jgi:hypothetical protein
MNDLIKKCMICLKTDVKSVDDKKSSEDIVVVIEGGKAGEEVIATKEGYLSAKGAVGFKLGSITSINKSG